MIARPKRLEALHTAMTRSPVVALLGPRQCGKTTLARTVAQHKDSTYLDLESPADQGRLTNPLLLLESLRGLVVIDEIQRRPDLFPILRVLADRSPRTARFLVLGSASPALIRQTSESLAGRVEFVELGGFDVGEVGHKNMDRLWLRGGFPRSFLARSNATSAAWRENFIRTFLERDIPQLGISIPAPALRRFWTMLAHYHGQIWNASELGRSLGLSDKTVRHYLDLLTATFMVRQLQPWHVNVNKRQVKSPKIYLRDTGLLHSLLALPDQRTLWGHPRVGASWEGFALEQLLWAVTPLEAYFWRTHSGAEIDLVLIAKGRFYGVECKWSEAPRMTPSLATAIQDLGLQHTWVLFPGKVGYQLREDITILPLAETASIAEALR